MAAGTALRKINAEVKRLKKKHPNSKHSTLQKQAGKAYRAGKLGRVGGKKKVHKKKVHHKKSHHKKVGSTKSVGTDRYDNKRTHITIAGITTAQAKSVIRAKTKDRLATALLQRDMATTKPKKRKISKRISTLRSQLNKYC
jgi:hypothetical protein